MFRSFVCALVVLAGLTLSTGAASAASTDLFFSEYVEGSSFNKALEIYNGTGADIPLTGVYSITVHSNGNPAINQTINLAGSIAAGDVFVLAHNSADPLVLAQADQRTTLGLYNGDDAVVLRKAGTPVDVIGQIGFAPAGGQWGSGDTSTADNTIRRKVSVTDGDPNGSDAFDPAVQWDGFPNNSFDGLGSHSVGPPPPNDPVVATCGSGVSTVQGGAATKTVTATDPDGRVLGFTATTSPSPAPGTIAITGQSPAAADGGTASATISISDNVAPGTYTVNVTASNDDATPQTATCSFTVTVTGITPIGVVQGSVGAADNGLFHRSSFAPPTGNNSGQTVVIKGVVYEKTLARTSAGANQYGFFIQNTAAQADGDPFTSDGIWVFMGAFPDVLNAVSGQPSYVPQVGDEIVLSGRAAEFFNFTQIASPRFVSATGTALNIDALLGSVEVDPPAVLDDANRYWERLESMRVRVPASSLITDGLDVFPATADAEMWVIRGDNPIASRSGYARRVFRDAHPLDDLPGLVDNGNGFRILVGALGLKALANDNTVLLPPSRTFGSVTNALVGGLNFSFNKYRIETVVAPALSNGIDPALNAPPTAPIRSLEYSIGDYNVENLYDFRDDPNDGCDFTGNLGCTGVNPPFDYVPASNAVYQERLGLIADQIVGDIHAPDVILIQEAEDQDICSVVAGALTCGATDNADGKPDTLQELALRIKAQSGISYDAAYDRDGADDRGIVAALMYRTDRVELLPATADHPVLGSSPAVEYSTAGNAYNTNVQNPKSLNAPLPPAILALPSNRRDGTEVYTRDPQVGLFRIWRTAVGIGAFTDVYAISNHFSSTPDGRIEQRREQARYLANIVDALGSEARVVAGGDFNVFPRPDDPVQPPSDQLAPLYDQGLENLWDTLVAEVPAAAYSYVFVGQAQTLDGQFVTDNLFGELQQTRVAHVNADFPADTPGDGARGLSDHDPMASHFGIPTTLETTEALVEFYVSSGAIRGNGTAAQLLHHLEAARGGNDAQLRAFINQVRGKTPRFITQAAADALVAEAQRLLDA
jgi:predicted extracellular nuclease